jgi:hypothetical protein
MVPGLFTKSSDVREIFKNTNIEIMMVTNSVSARSAFQVNPAAPWLLLKTVFLFSAFVPGEAAGVCACSGVSSLDKDFPESVSTVLLWSAGGLLAVSSAAWAGAHYLLKPCLKRRSKQQQKQHLIKISDNATRRLQQESSALQFMPRPPQKRLPASTQDPEIPRVTSPKPRRTKLGLTAPSTQFSAPRNRSPIQTLSVTQQVHAAPSLPDPFEQPWQASIDFRHVKPVRNKDGTIVLWAAARWKLVPTEYLEYMRHAFYSLRITGGKQGGLGHKLKKDEGKGRVYRLCHPTINFRLEGNRILAHPGFKIAPLVIYDRVAFHAA